MKVLLMAHHCSPDRAGDYAVGWHRLLQAARIAEVHLITGTTSLADLRRAEAAHLTPPHVVLHAPSGGHDTVRDWQRFAAHAAPLLHRRHRFHVLHHATPTSFRQPLRDLKLAIPTIWGPLTGAEDFPARFFPMLPPLAVLSEIAHTAANGFALWLNRNVYRSATTATALVAANSGTRHCLRLAFGTEVAQIPDSGIAQVESPDRTRFHDRVQRANSAQLPRPLRLLWAGDLAAHNALPILLRALAELGDSVPFELQVAGEGPMLQSWTALSRALGLTLQAPLEQPGETLHRRNSVQFLGALSLDRLRNKFSTAELLCYTTLRPTSPGDSQTLLAALATGVPVLCFDRHSAHDIISPACGTRVSVTTPRHAVQRWAQALRTYVSDPGLLLAQSESATERACRYLWSRNGDRINSLYEKLAGHP